MQRNSIQAAVDINKGTFAVQEQKVQQCTCQTAKEPFFAATTPIHTEEFEHLCTLGVLWQPMAQHN